jgi:hypothetical protein
MKLDRALQIASWARVRRYALPARNDAAPSSPQRGSDGRYLRGHLPKSPGRPRRDELRELYIDDLFGVWRTHGRRAIRQLAEEDPGAFLRIMVALVRKMRKPAERDARGSAQVQAPSDD